MATKWSQDSPFLVRDPRLEVKMEPMLSNSVECFFIFSNVFLSAGKFLDVVRVDQPARVRGPMCAIERPVQGLEGERVGGPDVVAGAVHAPTGYEPARGVSGPRAEVVVLGVGSKDHQALRGVSLQDHREHLRRILVVHPQVSAVVGRRLPPHHAPPSLLEEEEAVPLVCRLPSTPRA